MSVHQTSTSTTGTVRCAIYTRKSSEEGLDQAFNSLDAQREAGLDYIRSQKHAGWSAVDTAYNDGGFSGGTMKRPGLERLLADIDEGRVDVVVVYKVDRLSRSLNDFARMMQLFDDKQVSFVSVTQQFNTSTSMGRLTMNMLLSFAQFEREVASEWIRDKIAATKKQGYWVCGRPPLGYRVQHEAEPRGLYIVPEEAELVREIFQRFETTGSFVGVSESLNAEGHRTKSWTSGTGKRWGGKPLTQKYIYRVLTNPVMVGRVTHTRDGKTEIFKGRHEPIIDRAQWVRVQRMIRSQGRQQRHRWLRPHLLQGKLYTSSGAAMSPTSVHRPLTRRGKTGQKRLVRYYISQQALKHGFKTCPIKTINAAHLEDLVRGLVLDYIACTPLEAQKPEIQDHWVRLLLQRIVVSETRLVIDLDPTQIELVRQHEFVTITDPISSRATCLRQPEIVDRGRELRLTLDIQIKKLDGKRMLVDPDGRDLVMPTAPEPKRHIVDAIGLAYRWHDEMLKTGQHATAYAEANGLRRNRILELLPLTQLGPAVLKSALRGTLLPSITLDDLLHAATDLDWQRQADQLGLAAVPG